MWRMLALLSVLGLLGVAACGGGGGGDEPGPAPLYVDVGIGDDLNPGRAVAPFRSITRALQVAQTGPTRGSGSVIYVEFGTYDDTVETFPLVIPAGVVVDRAPQASIPLIRGGGTIPPQHGSGLTACVVVEAYGTLAEVDVWNTLTAGDPGFHYGVVMSGDGAALRSLHARSSLHGGVRVESGNDILIDGANIAMHTTGIGLHFAGGGAGGRVANANIDNNRIGVEFDAPGAALNGLSNAEGLVQIWGNSDTDVWVLPGVQVNARGCNWDHVPPNISTSDVGGGIDVYHLDGAAGIDVSDAGTVQI